MQEKEIALTPEHQDLALSKLSDVRAEILLDYVTRFKLNDRVDNNFFLDMAKENLRQNKFHETAVMINKFKFHSHFDCKQIILKLIDTNRIEIAKQLCDENDELKDFTINCLATNENIKIAGNLIKQWGKDINDYPNVKERLMKSSMRYYLGRYLYNKPGQDDYLPLGRVEDMFMGFKPMLVYLVEDLVFKGKSNEAKGVVQRHGIEEDLREDVRERLMDVIYDPKKDSQPIDFFGPLSEGNYMRLPENV